MADRVYVSLGTENRTLGSPNPNPNPNPDPNKVPYQIVTLIGSMSPWVLPDRTQGTFRQYPGRHRPYHP